MAGTGNAEGGCAFPRVVRSLTRGQVQGDCLQLYLLGSSGYLDYVRFLYRVSCTVSPVPCLLYRVSCTVSPVPCLPIVSREGVFCTISVPCLLTVSSDRVFCTVCSVPCLLYRLSCTVSFVPSLLHRLSCTISPIPSLLYNGGNGCPLKRHL